VNLTLKKYSISKKHRFWNKLKTLKRSQFNRFYNRSEFLIEEALEFSSPREISLDRCIKYVERGVDGDYAVVFQEDASDKEIKEVLKILEEELL